MWTEEEDEEEEEEDKEDALMDFPFLRHTETLKIHMDRRRRRRL